MSSPANRPGAAKIVVATTVALAFISFWRGAAIVLSDLASTMFYVLGIAEQAVGKSAPWFVLAVMLFGFAVRSIYLESCSMFVRGGVYVVVRDSLGPTVAKFSVSALIVDYVLTGPISSVSAGHYLAGLLNELSGMVGYKYVLEPKLFAAFFGVMVTLYFWWANVKGIHESSGKALRILQVMTDPIKPEWKIRPFNHDDPSYYFDTDGLRLQPSEMALSVPLGLLPSRSLRVSGLRQSR